jgi:hypothetical protein
MENLSRNSRFPRRVLNPGPHKYEAVAQRSVRNHRKARNN